VASPCWTTNTWKASIRAKYSLDDFCTFGTSSFHFSKDLSTTRRSKVCLLIFPLLSPFKGIIKECTSPFDSEEKKKSESQCAQGIPQLVHELFPSLYFSWEPWEFLSISPHSPCLLLFFTWQGKVFFHRPRLCSCLPHLSLPSFF